MKQVAVTDLAAYFDHEITAMPNLVSTGALDGGSITSGFGNIDNGSSTITTTGEITGGSFKIGGAVAIPASFGSAGQVLTVNGSGSAAEWADAGGGGGVQQYPVHQIANGLESYWFNWKVLEYSKW